MEMIELIANLIKILNSETQPRQISLGVCFAMLAGLTPLWRPHNLLVMLLVLVLRVNLSAFLLAWGVFSAIAYLLDPLFNSLGLAILKADALQGLWTSMYNHAWFPLTQFNHSITMGSLVFALVLFIPLLLLGNFIINNYREHILAWVRKTRLAQMIKASEIYSTYQSLRSWGGVR
jgi:uncharacterized protein (TIGR03546 family)